MASRFYLSTPKSFQRAESLSPMGAVLHPRYWTTPTNSCTVQGIFLSLPSYPYHRLLGECPSSPSPSSSNQKLLHEKSVGDLLFVFSSALSRSFSSVLLDLAAMCGVRRNARREQGSGWRSEMGVVRYGRIWLWVLVWASYARSMQARTCNGEICYLLFSRSDKDQL